MADPRLWTRRLRRGGLLLTGLCLVYLIFRFKIYGLNADAEALPLRFEPGQSVLLDMHAGSPSVGDAWLVRDKGGNLSLGTVQFVEGESMAMLFGRKGWQREDWVWLAQSQAQARVVMVMPW
ncbi:MAG: hypothetical protein R3F33_08640 [Planctomycetota bacterium]